MIRSLRLRLLLASSIVVVLIVAFLGYSFSRLTTNEFQRFADRDFLDYERLVTPFILLKLENFLQFRRTDCDQSLENLLDCQSEPVPYTSSSLTEFQKLVKDLGMSTGTRIVVADAVGRTIANSEWGEPGSREAERPRRNVAGLFLIEGDPFLVYIDLTEASGLGASQLAFLSSVNRALLIAVLSAVIAAILLTILLSRRILRPIEELILGARILGKGGLDYRVPIHPNDEIGELAVAFNTMADGLSHLEHLRRQMVSDVAHELRTPISNIRGYLEAIQDGLASATPQVISSLHEEILILSRLVDDLQELALAEAGKLHLEMKVASIENIIDRTVVSLTPAMNDKSLQFRMQIPGSLPHVCVDPERIAQILRNLLVNAITYTKQGGSINVEVQSKFNFLEVRVCDSGIGIAPENIELVFERFYRVDASRNRMTGGAGLGLAIVKQLVHAHGGEIGVKSVQGAGSEFWFTLPIHNPLEAKTVEADRRFA